MSNQIVNKERKFIGVKDLILGVMLGGVVLVIFFTVSPLLQPLGLTLSSILAVGIPAVIGGIIYVLLTTKSPRIGIHLVFTLPFVITFIVTGSLITSAMYFIGGLIGEMIMIGAWGKKWRPLFPYTILWLTSVFGSTVPMVFFRDSSIKTFMGMGMDEVAATAFLDSMIVTYTDPTFMIISTVSAIAACVLGYYIGVKTLHKHFKGAGVA